MNKNGYRTMALAASVALIGLLHAGPAGAGDLTEVRMSVDEDPIPFRLAKSLGYFKREGLKIKEVDIEKLMHEDFLIQEPLMKGQTDAAYHWFNHTIFGARHGYPIKAVMMFNDAPAMTIMVANRVKGQIHGAADFKGRNVAEGAGYATKAVITHYLAHNAGLGQNDYSAVFLANKGRQKAVIQGLKDDKVDVITLQEPSVSAIEATGLVSVLYDLNNRANTEKAIGSYFPAQSLMMSPDFIEKHHDTAQHLVNAFVRAMRFINAHSADEIIAELPPDYFKGDGRDDEIAILKKTMTNLARNDYAISHDAAALVWGMMKDYTFDSSDEGQFRATGDSAKVDIDQLYTNELVSVAMKNIP